MSLTRQFLSSIHGFVVRKDGATLRDWLQVSPESPSQYFQLAQELRKQFPSDAGLESCVEACLPMADDDDASSGTPWPGFTSFMRDYLVYWRDADFDNLPELHASLSSLLTACATALSHPTHGTLMLETSVAVSRFLAKLVMVLHRRPDLRRRMRPAGGAAGGGGAAATGDEERKSLVETTADAIQKLFTTCLADRSSSRWSPPTGKKVAVYRFANLVLKLLFAGNKARWAALLLRPEAADQLRAVFAPLAAAVRLDLADLLTVATLAQHQIEGWVPVAPAPRARPPHTNTLFLRAVANNAAELSNRHPNVSTVAPPPGGPRRLRPSEGLLWGNLAVTLADVESVVASLTAQGLLHGFVAHAAGKFAVVGAKAKGSAVRAGWPPVAAVIRERLQEEGVDLDSVPAWVKAP
ncbi:cop9 signalosome complex subunit 12 [Niveomyces insectorum RCEF 264]|uniref:Cop9 signalosome complex subunit 12 n=1 Tax=Niveomyces insectorum RCEF 264 TaxID=1081102 RepID=A0A167ZZN3_9HYPO|nr:cop9 signalosome complex subunit 12 [Niveomyces insectorum RCEF 264]